MKRSKYTDEQILAIVKESEAGRKGSLTRAAPMGSPSRPTRSILRWRRSAKGQTGVCLHDCVGAKTVNRSNASNSDLITSGDAVDTEAS